MSIFQAADMQADPFRLKFLSEGFGMLRTFASDLKAAGHEVTVLLDDRISKLNPPYECRLYSANFKLTRKQKDSLSILAKINDAIIHYCS